MSDGDRNEELQAHYIRLSGRDHHTSDCATSVPPAFEPGPCDCRLEDAERVPVQRETIVEPRID